MICHQHQIMLASRFNTYSSDGYDSIEAERDICIYSEKYFKHTSTSFLQGLRYTPTENISDWIKRKQSYKPAIAIPKTFEELLEEKIIFDFNFLFALDPVNINKEVNMLHRSTHIFCETIRDKIRNAMKKLFYNDKAMRAHMFNKKSPEQTKDEIDFINALGRMFNVRKEIRELAAEMDEKNGLSATYQHKEGLHIMDQMIKHNSALYKSIFAERA